MAGDYYIWFDEKGSESRALLYKLENRGIVKLHQEAEKDGFYSYKWELTKEGKEIVDKNKKLKELWKQGNILEFYNQIFEDE